MGVVTQNKFWTTPQLVAAQQQTERRICFIGVYAIAIINYPAKNFIVSQRYRAVSYKVRKPYAQHCCAEHRVVIIVVLARNKDVAEVNVPVVFL